MDAARMIEVMVPVITALLGSSGLWALFSARKNRHDRARVLLLGIARNQIIMIGKMYIAQGYIPLDEYEDFYNYLYRPYIDLGGNGMGEKLYEEISHLPMKKPGEEQQ